MKCFDDGEEIKALTCEDRTYLMGRGYMPEGFDEALVGMEPGQTKEFTFEAPLGTENGEVVNKPISCTVTVKEIQQEVVPIIDDAWVKANMPMFASREALIADMRRVFEPSSTRPTKLRAADGRGPAYAPLRGSHRRRDLRGHS